LKLGVDRSLGDSRRTWRRSDSVPTTKSIAMTTTLTGSRNTNVNVGDDDLYVHHVPQHDTAARLSAPRTLRRSTGPRRP